MKIGKRFLAILISMTVISGAVSLPVWAEETVPEESFAAETEPDASVVETDSPVVSDVAPTETGAEASLTADASAGTLPAPAAPRYFADNGEPSLITENADIDYIEHQVRSMSDLVAAFGSGNVTAISATELRLLRSFSMTSQGLEIVSMLEGTYRIDFIGFRVTSYSPLQALGANLTLLDSSAAKTGGWTSLVYSDASGVSFASAIYHDSNSLTVLSGRYVSPAGGLMSRKADGATLGGAVRIEGGEFLAIAESGLDSLWGATLWNNSSITITGGVFEGDVCGLELAVTGPSTVVRISGGSFRSTGSDASSGAIHVIDMSGGTPSLSGLLAAGATALPGNATANPGFLYAAKSVHVVLTTGTEGFVYRLYSTALGRNPDYVGYRDWTSRLKNLSTTGAGAAYGFVFSAEMNNRNLSDKDFVTVLYNVFLQRAPDQTGLNNWLYALSSGMSRQYVFSGFANSTEWKNLCSQFGITAGSYLSTEARDQNVKVTAFVTRLYSNCLNRPADVNGLNYWTGALNKKTQDGAHVAYGFFFSQEMINRKLSNDAFIETLYTVILNRAADAGGKANWVAQLNAGKTRLEVFKGFVNSTEFSMLCANYGIIRGTM